MCKLGSMTKRNGQYQTLNAFAMHGTSHLINSLINIDSLLPIARASTLICLIDRHLKFFLTDLATETSPKTLSDIQGKRIIQELL